MTNDAVAYGVTVEAAVAAAGIKYVWRCVRVHHLTPGENSGNHNLYVTLLDADGIRARTRSAWVSWPGDNAQEINFGGILQDKPDDEPAGNMPLWKNQIVSCGVNTQSGQQLGRVNPDEDTDIVRGLHTQHPDEAPAVAGGDPVRQATGPGKGNTLYHHSFLLEFRRVAAAVPGEGGGNGGGTSVETPEVPPVDGEGSPDPSLPLTVPEKYWGWREQVGQALSLALYRLACVVNVDGTKGAAATAGVDEVRKNL